LSVVEEEVKVNKN